MQIHARASRGDIAGVARLLYEGVSVDLIDTHHHKTPLMCAVSSTHASVEMVKFLIDRGANVNERIGEFPANALKLAVESGNFALVELLLESGADINYRSESGWDAVLYALHGRKVWCDPALLDLITLLVSRGASPKSISIHNESAIRAASCAGRFDAVQLLQQYGADPAQLKWTPLMNEIVWGSAHRVKQLIEEGSDLTARDSSGRTPWLLSLQVGRIEKAEILLHTESVRADRGHCKKTPMMYAIANDHVDVLSWLIRKGFDVEEPDQFNQTPLMEAAEHGAFGCAQVLVHAGANVKAVDHIGYEPIQKASDTRFVELLVSAGADLCDIEDDMRAIITGVEDDGYLDVSKGDYFEGKYRTFGNANPERMKIEFWNAMVRSGVTAYRARAEFGDTDSSDSPVWCFHRFGKSITQLPDGRFIEIGGEHEDFYDEDFCIYNDVVVHRREGEVELYGYPENVFPPTDFHSATLVNEFIYVVGGLGYRGARHFGETPVYRLHCESLMIERVHTEGSKPGWISGHKATLVDSAKIKISGGKICSIRDNKEEYDDNESTFILDLDRLEWFAPAEKGI